MWKFDPINDFGTNNFFITLAASVDQKGYEFVSGNFGGMSICYTKILFEEKIIHQLINPNMSETGQTLCHNLHSILQASGNSLYLFSFIVVNLCHSSCQLLEYP